MQPGRLAAGLPWTPPRSREKLALDTRLTARRAIFITAGIVLITGCAGRQATNGILPGSGSARSSSLIAQSPSTLERLGIAPAVADTARFSEAAPQRVTAGDLPSVFPQDLFVSDLGDDGVNIFSNGTYQQVGSITNGTNAPDGDWVDNHGNLYVANADGGNVTEYAPGATSPTCTYGGLIDPTNVTTDTHGNVFAVDFNSGERHGYIDEYTQCNGTVANRYIIKGNPTGAAVDTHGDLFVAYLNASPYVGQFSHESLLRAL